MPGKTIATRGGTAVMQNRAPKDVEGDDPKRALYRQLDLFCTPPWAARAGAEMLQAIDPDARAIREPACGKLHIADPIAPYFERVIASDVHRHTQRMEVLDWLDDSAWPEEPDCDWVFTNPPFKIADQFVTRGLRRARRGVALLLRIAFLEGVDRYRLMCGPDARLTLVATFSERVPMVLGEWDPEANSATCYAWFFWSKVRDPMPPAWFSPGTRDRLWLADDVQRYGVMKPAPLLDFAAVKDSIDEAVG